MLHFHDWLKQERCDRGLTQEEMAEALHCTQPTYWHYEKGNRLPPFQRMQALCAILELPVQEVVDRFSERSRRGLLARMRRQQTRVGGTSTTTPASELCDTLQELQQRPDMDHTTRSYVAKVLDWLRAKLPGRR